MPSFAQGLEQTFFRVWARRWDTVYDNFEKKLRDHIASQVALGRSQKDVLTELDDSLNNGQMIFKDLIGSVEREMDYGLNLEYQISSNFPAGKMPAGAEMVIWTLDPAAEHCDSCLYQASLPARDIATIPVPGSQPTVGEDNCRVYCRCSLEPVMNLEAANAA
jgi:hypothetical protein